MFALKDRPRGLEFPSCQPCNRGSALDEQVAALLSRSYPNASTQAERDELKRLFKAVGNNQPGLLEELLPLPRHELALKLNRHRLPIDAYALNVSGPLLNQAIIRFAAKLCCALRYEETNVSMPREGAIQVMWVTNFQFDTEDFESGLLKLLGPGRTLRQGKKAVTSQFRYTSTFCVDQPVSFHFGVFREAFAVYGFAADSACLFDLGNDVTNNMITFCPGWLKEHQNS